MVKGLAVMVPFVTFVHVLVTGASVRLVVVHKEYGVPSAPVAVNETIPAVQLMALLGKPGGLLGVTVTCNVTVPPPVTTVAMPPAARPAPLITGVLLNEPVLPAAE